MHPIKTNDAKLIAHDLTALNEQINDLHTQLSNLNVKRANLWAKAEGAGVYDEIDKLVYG